MIPDPQIDVERQETRVHLFLRGDWTLVAGKLVEAAADNVMRAAEGAERVTFDLTGIHRLDTAGAWLIDRARQSLEAMGAAIDLRGASSQQQVLFKEAGWRAFDQQHRRKTNPIVDFFEDVGRSVVRALDDFVHGVSFLGQSVVSIAHCLANPREFRFTSIIYHLENFGLRSVPIILLINFLVGCIVAQQGLFQLRNFGAQTFAVDLIGILILREMGVLLTSIMIAGRTGSAITAEIGSMKMREEVDALKVMGLSPMQVLVAPRLLALMLALPLLTFLADMSAIGGGMLVTWVYGGVSPEAFMSRLQTAIGLNTFLVGLIKAPFMALVIGIIATMDGMATGGSAESLGGQVTASVVKSIFMVIVIDGLFAMFFAAINF